MPIGITDEHQELHRAVRGWVERHCPPAAPRALLDAPAETLPVFWQELAGQGWPGIHVAEEHAGEGAGLVELAVVLEELGRAAAPGPFLGHALAAAALQAAVDAGDGHASEFLSGLAACGFVGTVALTGSVAVSDAGGRLAVAGMLAPVLSGHLAELVVADTGQGWIVLLAGEFEARELPSVDRTRRVAEVTVDATVARSRLLPALSTERVRDLAAVLFGAELVGGSQWCVDTAAEHARERRQFGRPIGQFQGVKHRCANMTARTELARAAVWDAARAAEDPGTRGFTAAAAAALTIDAAFETAKDCVQVLGGIGFTWEHDAHVYLRRAIAAAHCWGRRPVRGCVPHGRRWAARCVAWPSTCRRMRTRSVARCGGSSPRSTGSTTPGVGGPWPTRATSPRSGRSRGGVTRARSSSSSSTPSSVRRRWCGRR